MRHKDVQILGEIQELELIIEESTILHKSSTDALRIVKDLETKVTSLRAQTPPELLQRYDRLRAKGPAVVNVHEGICGGCRLNIPKGDLQRMRNNETPLVCPNCFKFIVLDS